MRSRAERRGEKLLDELFRVALDDGLRERGEVVSTLFATAPGIYRKFGYELFASYDEVEIPTAALAGVRAASGVRTRRATAADFDAVREVYDAWAAAQNGPLTRRGPSFPTDAQGFIDAFTGVTLAVDDAGEVVGFASWERGQGCGDVHDARGRRPARPQRRRLPGAVAGAGVVRQRHRAGQGVHLR